MQEHVKREKDDRGIVTLSLNRADVHNAFDDRLIASLSAFLGEIEQDRTCRGVILRSEGKSFSAGADLGWMKRMAAASEQENLEDARALGGMLRQLDQLPVPTIARVQGATFGGGVGLVACCDIAIASTRASFALSEVRLGLIPATISPYVIAAIGPRESRRLFLTAERIDAAHALRVGLVHDVVQSDDLDARVGRVVDELLRGGPRAQAQAKRLVRDVFGVPIDDSLVEDTSKAIASIRCSPEGKEGIAAFLERREPSW